MTIVIDASFAGAWLLPDEHSTEADRVLAAVLRGKERLAAPELWTYEMLNLIVSATRRGRIETNQLERAVRLIERIPVEFYDHQSHAIQERVLRLASRFSLSAYDAAYLELADRLQCPLRSLDEDLAAAGRSLGLV
jgi:predicted nucleic acid-binding protein